MSGGGGTCWKDMLKTWGHENQFEISLDYTLKCIHIYKVIKQQQPLLLGILLTYTVTLTANIYKREPE